MVLILIKIFRNKNNVHNYEAGEEWEWYIKDSSKFILLPNQNKPNI